MLTWRVLKYWEVYYEQYVVRCYDFGGEIFRRAPKT
jgi:hypothetical protein